MEEGEGEQEGEEPSGGGVELLDLDMTTKPSQVGIVGVVMCWSCDPCVLYCSLFLASSFWLKTIT